MKVAIEGCCHGCLNQIYKSIAKKKVDLLIICGDFQSIRNQADLQCMSVPDKYKKMGDFQDYYTGKKRATVFTIFIGGNHEASNYLDELKYGGFVAPNIYYMGRSSVVWYKGLRIGGLSGVYWKKDFMNLNPDNYGFQHDRSSIKSVYHYRKDDYFKLKLLSNSNNMVMVSHDWPEGIYDYGSTSYLLQKKPFFKNDVKNHCLGSPFNMELLKSIKPRHWFSAHLHVRFQATVNWNELSNKRKDDDVIDGKDDIKKENEPKRIKTDTITTDEIELDMNIRDNENNIVETEENMKDIEKEIAPVDKDKTVRTIENNDEIQLDFEDINDIEKEPTLHLANEEREDLSPTAFLALDKCLPRRNYLEIIDIDPTDKNHISAKSDRNPLYYDHEYISSERVIQKHKLELNSLSYEQLLQPPIELLDELNSMKDFYSKEYENLGDDEYTSLFNIPKNAFARTASPHERYYKKINNPQTKSFEDKFLNN